MDNTDGVAQKDEEFAALSRAFCYKNSLTRYYYRKEGAWTHMKSLVIKIDRPLHSLLKYKYRQIHLNITININFEGLKI